MRRNKYTLLISESAADLLALERSAKNSISRDRVRFIRLLKEGECTTQGQAGERIGLKLAQSQLIWRLYREQGIHALAERRGRRSWGKLDSRQISRLRTRLSGHDLYTQQQVIDWLEAETGVVYTQSGMCKLLQRLKIKLKTGRQVNVRKDEAGAVAFKKILHG